MAKVLVVGSGGREHALGYGLSRSKAVEHVYFAPGNGGTAAIGTNLSLRQEEIPDWAAKEKVDLVVVGPEAPLVDGLADALRAKGLKVCGPSAAGAQLEASKAVSAEFMADQDIPQPPFKIVESIEDGLAAIDALGGPTKTVIKADGLAAGKGVFLPETAEEADQALESIFAGEVQVDGSAGKVVIQTRYHGPEASVFVLSDGEDFYIIPVAAQDHKRLLEGDKGPNTGGVGAYAPVPKAMLGDKAWERIRVIAEKSISGMKQKGTPYQGVLYLGLMLADELKGDPIVIEYNVRFGDPEAEVLLPLLTRAGVDIYQLLLNTATPGGLKSVDLPKTLDEAGMTVVLAAEGYPKSPNKGDVILGLDKKYDDVVVFHSGTKSEPGKTVTSGGRVICVTGFGKTLADAAKAAYAAIGEDGVHFRGMHYRKDIGHRVL